MISELRRIALENAGLPAELKSFSRDPDGTLRTTGHTVVAWWVGNWASPERLHTQGQLKSLADMIDKIVGEDDTRS